MGRKKPTTLEQVKIEGLAEDGKCIAHHNGQAIFVSDVAPGDVVDVLAYKARKNFMMGRPTKYHTLSSVRVEPVCEHFSVCGGCKWQHVAYEEQLRQKEQIVTDSLQRIGKIDFPEIQPIIGSKNQYHYRNKLEFTFSNKRWLTKEELNSEAQFDRNALGFHIPKLYDKIVDIDTCHLQPEPTNLIKNEIRKYALENDLSFYDIREKSGFLRNLIIRITSLNEVMVILQVGHNDDSIQRVLGHIDKKFPEITALMYVVNNKMNETFNDLTIETFKGRDFIWEEMESFTNPELKLRFRIGPKSFFQTNSQQAQTLYRTALEFAGLTGQEVVYDLYTGTGSIALYASSLASKVVGIEYVEDAIEDAKRNATENNISNVEFIAGDMKDTLNNEIVNKFGAPNLIITDPPRAGMHQDVVLKILEMSPEKVVYISCNPATQARDIALMDKDYRVERVQPVDMFPHTQHIENIILLTHK